MKKANLDLIASAFWHLDRVLNNRSEQSLKMSSDSALKEDYRSMRTALSDEGVVDEFGNVLEDFKSD